MAVSLLIGAGDATAQVWSSNDGIYLNVDFDGGTQRVSFRQLDLVDAPLAANFPAANVAVESLVVNAVRYTGPGAAPTVAADGEICVLVTAPDGSNNDWSNGTLEIDVTATDQNGVSDQITLVSIQGGAVFPSSAECQEAAPVANPDTFNTTEDAGSLQLTVLDNDTASVDVFNPGASITISNFDASAAEALPAGSFSSNGSVITYTPLANFSGQFQLTYNISSGNFSNTQPTTGVVTVNVAAQNDAPSAVDDSGATAVDQPITVDVLSNDSDPDPGDVLTVSDVTQGASGSVVNNGTDVTYTPNSGFVGIDTFTYTISDGVLTDTATVTIDVGGVNSPPTAVDDSATTTQDVAVDIDVLANDSDVDGDTLTVSDVADGASGTVINNGTNVTYTPNAGFSGSDVFTYTVTDGVLTDTATVSVTVQQVNNVPVPQDDVATTQEDTPVTINVLSNDSDPEGDPLTVVGVTQPANGGTAINVDPVTGLTTVTYTPNSGFFGDDTFTYDVSDDSFTATANVTVTVEQRFRLENIAITPNQRSVGRTVDNVCPRLSQNANELVGDQNDLLTKCSNLIANEDDPDAQRRALDEISGREISTQQTTGIDFTQVQLTNIGARMQALRQGVRGSSFAGLQLYHDGEYIPAAQLAAMAKDLAGGGSGDEDSSEPLQSRWGFFGRGKINIGDKDATDNEAGFDFDSWGVTLGVDYRITDNFVVGVAGGFNSGESEFDNDGGAMESDGTSAHLFGVMWGERAYLDFVASFGQLDYDSTRNISYTDISGPVSATAVGSTDGDLTAIGIAFGYEFNKGAWSFTPNIAATMIEVDVDPFVESGAGGLDLSFAEQNAKSRTIEGGFRLSYTSSREWGVIIPEFRASFVKENDNDSEIINVQFVNDPFANDPNQPSPGITLITDEPDDSYVRLGFALNAQFRSGLSGFVDYETLSGLNLVTSHEFTVGLRYQKLFR